MAVVNDENAGSGPLGILGSTLTKYKLKMLNNGGSLVECNAVYRDAFMDSIISKANYRVESANYSTTADSAEKIINSEEERNNEVSQSISVGACIRIHVEILGDKVVTTIRKQIDREEKK
ncbi:unnamed protein product [Dovyalis caffra]|uniref:Uncharacterized protein n=1 Tax=Dovyalis caffra TaxID=77055 RepID=A0AAV1RDF6_9ROSI|nr:unnamed protein product [Dovyalis caffra]